MDISLPILWLVACCLARSSTVFGSAFHYDVSIYEKVTRDAKHWWKFDEATSLYSIADKITEKRAIIREGGAKLTRIGRLTNNYLTLEGQGSSIELGRFGGCISDITSCKNGFTFSLWLRFRDIAAKSQYFLGNAVPGTNEKGFVFLRTQDKEMQVSYTDTNGEFYAKYSAVANMWLHHLITWDGRRIIVYVNGKKLMAKVNTRARGKRDTPDRGMKDLESRNRRATTNSLFSLGRHSFKIDADYDDVIFWNRVLNETEAAVVYYRDMDDPGITGCKRNASSLCLSWNIPDDAYNRIQRLFLKYQYQLQANGPVLQSINTTEHERCIDNLGALTTYTFTLEVHIKNNHRVLKSKTLTCRTTDGVPNIPKLSIGDKTTASIEAIWLTPSPTNGAIIAYSLTVKTVESNTVKVRFKLNAHETLPGRIGTYKVNVTHLDSGTVYLVEVRAISELGASDAATIKVVTEGIAVPRNDIKAVAVDGDKIRISWKPIVNAISYRLYLKPINSSSEAHFDVFSNSTEFLSLRPLTTYIIDIQPMYRWGIGPRLHGKKVVIRTPDQKTIPSDIKAKAIGWNKILVTWGLLPSKGVLYKVYLKGDSGTERFMQTRTNNVLFRGLKPVSTYTVDIQARLSWGLGPRMYACAIAKTQDKNECEHASLHKCHRNADCYNVEGSYLCQCREGFVGDGFSCRRTPAETTKSDFCEASKFRDVQWPRIFKGGTVVRQCPNGTAGFASRKCLLDRESKRAVYHLPNLSDCVSEEVVQLGVLVENPNASATTVAKQLIKVTTSTKLYGGDVKKTVVYYEKTIRKKLQSRKLVAGMSQTLMNIASNLLNSSVKVAWKDLPRKGRNNGVTTLFDGLELLAEKISASGASSKRQLFTRNIDMEIQNINGSEDSLTFIEKNSVIEESKSQISLPSNEIIARNGGKSVEVIFFSYANVDQILSLSQEPTEIGNQRSWDILNSKVLSASVMGVKKVAFQSPAVLVLPHLKKERVINTSCVFWNISESGNSKWLNNGCYVNSTDANQTVCHCYHLTNFAVLMTVSNMPVSAKMKSHQFALRIVTIIGLTISIIAMSVAFLTFCCFRKDKSPGLKDTDRACEVCALRPRALYFPVQRQNRFLQSPRTTYHKHLIASLILANLLFLVGIDRTENQTACTIIAVFLHYFFIVAFVWMAMEGVLLYFMLRKIFSSRNFLKRKRCMILCWVLPAIYVGTLCALQLHHYGNNEFCWISRKDGFIWSFVTPVSVTLIVLYGRHCCFRNIILEVMRNLIPRVSSLLYLYSGIHEINFAVMAQAFHVMSEKRNKAPDDGTAADVWYWLKGCLVLTCLLGVTWILGVFYVDSNTVGFAYVFTLLNALQGLFIFIFHCLIDSRVRSEYMRLIKCQKRYEYNEKAGYSSSMKFRKLSGSIKSLGSLDRSMSHSSAKRTLSNSLDRSVLRHNNGSLSEYGKFTLLRSYSGNKDENEKETDKHSPELQPLVQSSFSSEITDPENSKNEHSSSGLLLHDEKAGSSYSSVFESENEERRRIIEARDSLCISDPVAKVKERSWEFPTHGSDSGVSVRSEMLQGESFDINTTQVQGESFEETIEQAASTLSLHSEKRNSFISLKSVDQETISQELVLEEELEPADEPELAVEVIEDKAEIPLDMLDEECHTCSLIEDKRFSLILEKLEDVSSENEEDVFEEVSCRSMRRSQALSIKMNRSIEFEVEERPRVETCVPLGRCGTPDRKERAETSLRIGVPRLISVSSIESEPISPIIISIDPEDREFNMLEAEIEFSDDASSTNSEDGS